MRGKTVSLPNHKNNTLEKHFLFHTYSYHRIEFQLVIQVDRKSLDKDFLCA